jgi:hypothetical protein
MDTTVIIAELEAERDRLNQAINALTASYEAGTRRGRKPGRHLSPASRKKIGDAMRKTWAERKKKMKAA